MQLAVRLRGANAECPAARRRDRHAAAGPTAGRPAAPAPPPAPPPGTAGRCGGARRRRGGGRGHGGDLERLRDARAGPAAHPAASITAAPAAADPDSPQARYVDRLCASGTLLSTLGSTAISPTPGSDPAQLKRDYLAAADRTIGTVQAALPDLTVLRDEAPNGQVKTQFGLIVSEFTKARDAFTAGRAAVAAAQPLTVEAYRTGVNSYLEAPAASRSRPPW